MSARLADRWRLTLPLALPTLGGLAYLAAFAAPARLIAVNAGALALGMAWVMFGRMPQASKARIALAAAASGLLFLPLLTGPALSGVARWLPAGPITLHTGPLLLPLIVVLAARAPHAAAAAVLATATLALALQPDAAGLAALAAASAVLAVLRRQTALALVGLAAALGAAMTFAAGALEPQLYTENVLAHVAGRSAAGAVALGLLLLGAPLWWLAIRPVTPQAEGAALAALLIGLSAAAIIAPFPFALIGYGASPIIGMALALSATEQPERSRAFT